MKKIQFILAAAVLLTGFASCSHMDMPTEQGVTYSQGRFVGWAYKQVFTMGGGLRDSIYWAPVNVGYDRFDAPYGKLIQWGRKDAFMYGTAKIKEGPAGATYSADTLYYNATAPFDWQAEQQAEWAEEFNPCPQGWRLPTQEEMQRLLDDTSLWNEMNKGRSFAGALSSAPASDAPVFFIAAGYINYEDGHSTAKDEFGKYWTATTNGTKAIALSFDKHGAALEAQNRANAFSVRCVKK